MGYEATRTSPQQQKVGGGFPQGNRVKYEDLVSATEGRAAR